MLRTRGHTHTHIHTHTHTLSLSLSLSLARRDPFRPNYNVDQGFVAGNITVSSQASLQHTVEMLVSVLSLSLSLCVYIKVNLQRSRVCMHLLPTLLF